MINSILGWVPLIVFWTLQISGVDMGIEFIALPSFSLGVFIANILAVR